MKSNRVYTTGPIKLWKGSRYRILIIVDEGAIVSQMAAEDFPVRFYIS